MSSFVQTATPKVIIVSADHDLPVLSFLDECFYWLTAKPYIIFEVALK